MWIIEIRKTVSACKSVFAFLIRLVYSPAMQEIWVQSLGWEDPLEKEMATHSSILALKIPWMEDPGRLQSLWSPRVRAISLSKCTCKPQAKLWSKKVCFLAGVYPCLVFSSSNTWQTPVCWQVSTGDFLSLYSNSLPLLNTFSARGLVLDVIGNRKNRLCSLLARIFTSARK